MPTEELADRGGRQLEEELAGIDLLEVTLASPPSPVRRVFRGVLPKAAALAIGVLVWQIVVWSHWKPSYLLPGPLPTWRALVHNQHDLFGATGNTLLTVIEGYFISLVVGTMLAILITRIEVVRRAVSPLITGFQAMPSVSWVPLAILLFGVHDQAVLFVTVLGSAPALAIGTIAGIDSVSPVLLRAGKVLGARGFKRYLYVVLPGALPGYVTGLKQGWAFAWRSVMAGELIAQIQGHPTLGGLQSTYQDHSLAPDLLAVMVVILAVGLLMDALVFSRLENTVLTRRAFCRRPETVLRYSATEVETSSRVG